MAGSINKVVLVGNVGNNPEIRFTQNGAKIATFSVATSESWQDKTTNERKDNTQWHRVVVFNENLADIVEKYVKKGSKVYLEGSLQYRKYTDSNSIERNTTEVVLNRFKSELLLLDSRSSSDKSNYNNQNNNQNEVKNNEKDNSFTDIANNLDDDIPF